MSLVVRRSPWRQARPTSGSGLHLGNPRLGREDAKWHRALDGERAKRGKHQESQHVTCGTGGRGLTSTEARPTPMILMVTAQWPATLPAATTG
jgi:hypothetical protein